MKKLILTVFFSVFYLTSASADMGVNLGLSGQAGVFFASAEEHNPTDSKNTGTGSEHGEVGYASVFAEVSIGDRFMVGIDYVPDSLETETAETHKSDKRTANSEAITASTNKIQVDFEDLTTYYAAAMLTENLYVKVGAQTVEVVTNETLGTGSKYGNTDLDGTMFGVGYHKVMDNGMFFRAEGTYSSFDSATVKSDNNSDRQITLRKLDGVSGKLSIGTSF